MVLNLNYSIIEEFEFDLPIAANKPQTRWSRKLVKQSNLTSKASNVCNAKRILSPHIFAPFWGCLKISKSGGCLFSSVWKDDIEDYLEVGVLLCPSGPSGPPHIWMRSINFSALSKGPLPNLDAAEFAVHSREACSSQILNLSKSTKIATNTETPMLSSAQSRPS